MASTTSSQEYTECEPEDTLCEVRMYEQEVIIVPVLLLLSFVVTLTILLLLRFCPEKVHRVRPRNVPRVSRGPTRIINGIDAPPGLNALEGESIALDLSSTYSTFTTLVRGGGPARGIDNPVFGDAALLNPREAPRQRLPEKFKLVTSLPSSFALKSDSKVSLYRARMENRNVVLHVLTDSASETECQSFLGFASFLSQLGPHPFLPELIGVVTLRAPLIMVMEELENQDLLSYLWKCRQAGPDSGVMTERQIFTMASQVASALEFLHSKDLIHGNIRARSVLITQMLTAKLWGLGDVYTRKTYGLSYKNDPGKKKWQAPEILANREVSQKSDVWSFGLLLYEMVTLGEVPFAEVPVNELLQFLQRGKSLKKPHGCSSSLHTIIKGCCHWKEQDRFSLADLRHKLQSGEKSANDKTFLRASQPISIQHYIQEAGYGEAYTVF
ncbi:tyrosine-protein kinase STYK1b [Pangasianodon hypophthalmus]|uniref:tyrosine-protein kinase STYK1b n=1 Tax=Pangasianodon hypophthalmus TaxID=310915 RepID=UPI000EFE4314|nr:tyrosine-protein kinase STYK1b [Pangasianodon hypophthalmus]XP_053090615.1 tyrosine-protein kinase STYK1b [Pangasianodon hypophthalmus]XP_053090620.1 tyrosine-protein kinase STYK1b [Pangasianodon hypophthalmus]